MSLTPAEQARNEHMGKLEELRKLSSQPHELLHEVSFQVSRVHSFSHDRRPDPTDPRYQGEQDTGPLERVRRTAITVEPQSTTSIEEIIFDAPTVIKPGDKIIAVIPRYQTKSEVKDPWSAVIPIPKEIFFFDRQQYAEIEQAVRIISHNGNIIEDAPEYKGYKKPEKS